MSRITKKSLDKFKIIIWEFYRMHRRSFPWRQTKNPYRILVSEIMLQQTQTSRVVKKYKEFLRLFPTVKNLADATTAQILGAWQGLGYNRRALHLKRAAEIIHKEFKGKVPRDPAVLSSLPGIGKATAGAICAYAYNMPMPFIETNIRRIYLHYFFTDQSGISDLELLPLVEKTLDVKNPREWYWALMDYGSYLPRTVANPNRLSKHYAKQSKFQGSHRQRRGIVLKYLTERGKATKTEISNVLGQDASSVMEELVHEGFIRKKRNIYTL